MRPDLQPDLISLTVGGCIVAFGVLLTWSHWPTWVRQQQEFINDPRELRYLQARFRRRVQTSALIAFVGVLIPIADLPIVWAQGPLLAAILWLAIGCVCLWISLLAAGDWATTRAHSQATLARLQAHKETLLNQLERLRPEPKTDEK